MSLGTSVSCIPSTLSAHHRTLNGYSKDGTEVDWGLPGNSVKRAFRGVQINSDQKTFREVPEAVDNLYWVLFLSTLLGVPSFRVTLSSTEAQGNFRYQLITR